jgi:hypothetical protein
MRGHSLRLAYSNLHPKSQRRAYLRKQRVHAKKSENTKPPMEINTKNRLIQNEPSPAPTKPTFSTKDQDNASTLAQITDDLVALHIGHNLNLTSATMLVNSGASHILVRQEHIHVLEGFRHVWT